MRGLQVVFHKPLHETPSGVSPDSAVFPFEYLQAYDLEKRNSYTARRLYVFQSLNEKEVILFQSDAPNTIQIWTHSKMIARIKDLTTDRIIFPKSATG